MNLIQKTVMLTITFILRFIVKFNKNILLFFIIKIIDNFLI